jgi:multisubunit Na+/H+ antiporter MnhB subunit
MSFVQPVDKNELAYAYAWIDVIGTIFFVSAWLWLRRFESEEERVLNRNTVTASDYTIRLKSIPSDTTEKELAVHFAEVTGQAVAAVHLAFNNSKEIQMYINRGQVMRQRYKCVQKIRYEKTVNDGQYGQKKRLRKLMREREDLTASVRAKDKQRMKVICRNQKAIEAYVTFESESGFIQAMMKYHLNWFRTYCCCYPERLKFKGMRLSVEKAPDPSTIIWENLEYSNGSRTFRKGLTTIVALMAILFSVALTFLARDYKGKVLVNGSKPCPDGFFSETPEDQLDLINNDIDLAHCYCSTLTVLDQWNFYQCHDNIKIKAKATAMGYGAGFIVVFMNTFFTWLMDRAGEFEKHQSLDRMETSNMVRVFLLKFVNTGCLVLLYGQKWLQRLVRIKFEDASEFNVDWYATGGTSLMIVMFMNIISPHVGAFVGYFRHKAKLRRLEKSLTADKETDDKHDIWYTQEDLNDFYRGPPFKIHYRYSQVLVTIYICWMYAVSMPIMPLFGAVSCYISYWVDKYLFCNFYRTPPMYSDDMGKTSTKLLGYLVVVHLVMSMWMMGCEEIFIGESISEDAPFSTTLNDVGNTTSSVLDKLRKKHLVPLLATLLAFLAGQLLSNVSSAFLRRVCGCLRCLTCTKSSKVKHLTSSMNTVQVDYSSARDREIIKGLATYNILQNPK